MNMVVRSDDKQAYQFNVDIATAEDLLADYLNTDSSDMMTSSTCKAHLVLGNNSHRWDSELLRQLESAANTAAGGLEIHKLEKAGHWMHNEPEAVCNLITAELASKGR